MKHLVKTLLIGMVALIASITHAQHDTVGAAVEINSVNMTGILPSVGDTVQLLIQLRANVTDSVRLHIGFPGDIAPPDQGVSETERVINVAVESDSTYNYTIPMKIYAHGGSQLTIYAIPKTEWSNLQNVAYEELEIENSPTVYQILSNMHDSATVEIPSLHIGGPITLSFTGKVRYNDFHQKRSMGVYGVKVILLFHRHGVTGSTAACSYPLNLNYSHPIPGLIEGVGLTNPGVHSCKTDAEGNFSFSFTAGLGNWNVFTDAVLLVTNSNDGCELGAPVGTYTVVHPNVTWKTFRVPTTKCFEAPNDDEFNLSNITIQVSPMRGAILRYSQIANDFYEERPLGTRPDPILVTYRTRKATGISQFIYYTTPVTIDFDSPPPSIQITCHEYGHYANWTLWGNTFGDADGYFVEGFGNLYSYAVQNYANANYGDYLYWKWNSEEWPFYNNRYWGDNAPPYSNSVLSYDIPHCFLWNVYDAYDDEGFKANGRDGLDNDDVGHPLLIFETDFPASPNNTMEGFKDALIAAVGGGEEGESIQDIYDFVYGDQSQSLDPMRPAQITELSAFITGYQGNTTEIFMTWEHRAYGTIFFQNPPTGVKIYQDDDQGGWTYVTSSAFPSASKLFYGNSNLPQVYKATSYNATGESFDAPDVTAVVAKMASGDKPKSTPTYTLSASPNPFFNETKITLKLGAPAYGVIQVFDLLGREVDAKQFHELRPTSVDFDFKTESSNQPYHCKAQIHFEDGTLREESFTIIGASR